MSRKGHCFAGGARCVYLALLAPALVLAAQGLGGLPLSGQDGDHAALNRVARGLQTVSVWKDARALGRAALGEYPSGT